MVQVRCGVEEIPLKAGAIVSPMGANTTHAEYDRNLVAWSRARDVLAGEDAVKAAGERYLPKLDSQSAEEYGAYKERAAFFGATARTLEEYLDLIFKRVPCVSGVEQAGLKQFVKDCDLWGTEFVRYARHVVSEVLSVGRGGSLVILGEGSDRPVVSFWRAEDIINWSVERESGRVILGSVVLRVGGADVTVLKRSNAGCVRELWMKCGEEWVCVRSGC